MNCNDTKKLIGNHWFITGVFGQLIGSIISVILCLLVVKKCGSLYFHANIRVLLVAKLCLYLIHSVLITIIQTFYLILYFFTDPCGSGIPSTICICLRFPAMSCVIAFAVLEFAMIMERAIAMWKHQYYENYGPNMGIALVILSVIISPAALFSSAGGFGRPSSAIYCNLVGGEGLAGRFMGFGVILCGTNVATLVGIIVLSFSNKFLLKRKSFHLSSSYQLRESEAVIRILLPLTIIQNLFCLVFSIFSIIIPILRDQLDMVSFMTALVAVYIVPYYTTISPIFINFMVRRSQQLKENRLKSLTLQSSKKNEVYFETYRKMWHK